MELHSLRINHRTSEEIERMRRVPYAKPVGSLMYVMLCTRPDVCFVVGMVSRYQSNLRPEHWTAVKHIIKYLKRTKNYMLVYYSDELIPVGYTDLTLCQIKIPENQPPTMCLH